MADRFRLLVLPQRLQHTLFSKSYRTRSSGRSLGRLKGFVDLPIDIVFETAMYLDPKDLLQLSRLSKQFRSIFASRSALFVWRTAFRNLNIKCLSDLNELQFASLIYDKCCMACGRTMRCQLFLILRLRLCPSCQTANLITIHDLQNQYQNAWDLICHLPASSLQCFKPEAQLIIQRFLSLKTENSLKYIDNVKKHSRAKHEDLIPILYIINPIRTKQSCVGYGLRR
ncbi:hypothetical protein BYT27DRAFT_7129162 [Phlegmacium glaucopus]|nr:hypothetical protein BYT27DRAFT_7129162 [Phlegmacium glaucopus]